MKRLWVIGILVLAFLGLADAAYLARSESNNEPLICNIQGLSDCNVVASSPYSQLFGVSLAEYGVLFYGILFVLAALELVLFDRLLRRALQGLAIIGVLSSLYFTSVQVFLVGAFCIYCLISAVLALLVFIFATRIEPMRAVVAEDSTPPAPSLPMPPL